MTALQHLLDKVANKFVLPSFVNGIMYLKHIGREGCMYIRTLEASNIVLRALSMRRLSLVLSNDVRGVITLQLCPGFS